MIAYKFLCRGGVGLFSGFAWPLPSGDAPGEWVSVHGPLRESASGIHACRVADLAGWLDDELWRVELGGQIAAQETTVVSRRARLLARVAEWDGETADAFTTACVMRERDRAVEALRRDRQHDDAGVLAGAVDVAAIRAVTTELATRLEETTAGPVIAFAADTAVLARGQRPDAWRTDGAPVPAEPRPAAIAANLGFVGAHGAGLARVAAGGAYERGVADERGWQAQWLADRLGLDIEPSRAATLVS